MSNDDFTNDAEALKAVLDVLSAAAPGVRPRILQAAALFFGLEFPAGMRSATTSQSSPLPTVPFSEKTSPSAKEFMLQKQPRSDVEKVACLAYYLTHFRDMPFFKTSDISLLNTEAAQIKFSNAAFAVANATKQGYLVPASKGAKQISAQGEQFVDALPDRDSARSAMVMPKRWRKSRKSSDSMKKARRS